MNKIDRLRGQLKHYPEELFLVWHVRATHWVLVHVNFRSRLIAYYDSMGICQPIAQPTLEVSQMKLPLMPMGTQAQDDCLSRS